MWTPLQMEMLAEVKAKADRGGDRAKDVREVKEAVPGRGHQMAAATASRLRKVANRLDPTPLPGRRPALAVYPGGTSGRTPARPRQLRRTS
jgi:hypothetical protein